MRGWLRSDGRKGIRNVVVVAYLVECARHVATMVAREFEERDVHVIGFPGCYPNRYAHDMMVRLCTHPERRRRAAGVAGVRELRPLGLPGRRSRPPGGRCGRS